MTHSGIQDQRVHIARSKLLIRTLYTSLTVLILVHRIALGVVVLLPGIHFMQLNFFGDDIGRELG